jgi:hypothetical protein
MSEGSVIVSSMPPRKDYGPHQLADHLGTYRSMVERARHFGLIPEPDLPRGRWSAAVADDLREKLPEIEAGTKCLGAAGLKKRGWTEAMIRDLLGEPDWSADNPHYKTAAPMRLWRVQRIDAAETSPEFTARQERAQRACAAAAKATETRKVWKALGGT